MGLAMKYKFKGISFLLTCISLSFSVLSPFVQGFEVQASYGYNVGDFFIFTDSIIESVGASKDPSAIKSLLSMKISTIMLFD